jgi:hypothetical protein
MSINKCSKCPKLSKSVQKCPKVSKSVQKCPKVSKGVLKCPKVSKIAQKCPRESKSVYLKILVRFLIKHFKSMDTYVSNVKI